MNPERSPARLVFMAAGMIAWAGQFTIIYAVTAVACARGYADLKLLGFGLVPATIAVTTLAALAVTSVVLAGELTSRPRMAAETAHPNDRFLNYMTASISGLSLVAISWTGLPPLILPACA